MKAGHPARPHSNAAATSAVRLRAEFNA